MAVKIKQAFEMSDGSGEGLDQWVRREWKNGMKNEARKVFRTG